jgi:hypothetical protein
MGKPKLPVAGKKMAGHWPAIFVLPEAIDQNFWL